jgi:Bacteriophage holin family
MKSFLHKHITGIIMFIVAYFAPLYPLLLAVTLFCVGDFILGLIVARKQKSFNRDKLFNKTRYLLLYIIMLVFSFYYKTTFVQFVQYPLSDYIAFSICGNEFWNMIKKISILLGKPITKETFAKYIQNLAALPEEIHTVPKNN